MSKNKLCPIGSLLTLVILSACARDEAVLWREFQARRQAAALDRRPAQAEGATCFEDRFKESLIQKEIKQMQDLYPREGEKRRLTFGKRDYDNLHPALVDFLTAHNHLQKEKGASWIAAADAQTTCPDASDPEGDSACFVQKLYAAPNGDYKKSMEGLVHYWFFLKTGVVMSAQATYPWYHEPEIVNQTPTGTTLNQYLFSADEWRAWWKMAHLLPPSMTHMPSLETVHRIPRGTHPAEWKRGQACGLSFGSWNSGLSIFDDNCLLLNPNAPDDATASFFYPATTHEFGHRLSAWAFNRDPAHARINLDESPEFLKISGWKKAQLVTPEGLAQVQWESSPKANYVSSFARVNPSEDFAETVGYFRTNPVHASKAAKEKYEFVKRLVFNDHGYTREELEAEYAAIAVRSVMENLGEILPKCVTAPVAVPMKTVPTGSPVASASPVTSPISEPVVVTAPALANPQYGTVKDALVISEKLPGVGLACVQNRVLNQIAEAIKSVRYKEPEGCATLKSQELEIVTKALSGLGAKLSPYLKGEIAIANLALVTAEFRKKLGEEYDARATLLLCWRQADARDCYQKAFDARMEVLFDQHGSTLETLSRDAIAVEKARAQREYAYDVVVAQTAEYYESLMTTQLRLIPAQAETLWINCREERDATDLTTVKLTPYTAGVGYLPEPVLSCLNHHLEESEFPDLRARAGADHKVLIVIPEANAWIDEKILLPRYKAVLDQKIAAMQADDRKRFEAASASVVDSISQSLIEGFATWQPGGAFLAAACKAEAGKRLLQRFPESDYRFLPLGAEMEPLSNRICEKVRVAVAANAGKITAQTTARTDGQAGVLPERPIPASMIERTPDAVYQKLVPALVTAAKSRFSLCHEPQYKSARLRRYCLFTEWVEDDQDHARKNAWAWTRDRGVRAWLKDPEVVKYRQSKGYPEEAFFEALQTRVDDESDPFVEAILDAFGE